MSVCYVTAYLEIGRENWKFFKRTFDEYFSSFINFLNVYKNDTENNFLYIFMDKSYLHKLASVIENIKNIVLIPIDEQYMFQNSVLWNRIESEEKIMNSEEYKNLIAHRSNCPETHNPKYTLINHAKVDFVKICIDMCKADYFCWVDFGYCNRYDRIPSKLLDIEKLDKNKVNYTLINPINSKDTDIIYTLVNAPEKIGGFFFFGNRNVLKEYQKLYHKVHLDFQNKKFVDDDQHIALLCYFENQRLFQLHYLGGWHRALNVFQK